MASDFATLLGLLLSYGPAVVPEPAVRSPVLDAASADSISLALLEADTRAVLNELGLDATLTARVKSPRSLSAKARRKGLPEDQVLDRLALRVRVDTEADCYTVMNTLLDRFELIEGSADDYIATPKANGYRSLHAAVRTPVGTAEFQVRTHEMHHHAEHGAASHHAYKVAQGLA